MVDPEGSPCYLKGSETMLKSDYSENSFNGHLYNKTTSFIEAKYFSPSGGWLY